MRGTRDWLSLARFREWKLAVNRVLYAGFQKWVFRKCRMQQKCHTFGRTFLDVTSSSAITAEEKIDEEVRVFIGRGTPFHILKPKPGTPRGYPAAEDSSSDSTCRIPPTTLGHCSTKRRPLPYRTWVVSFLVRESNLCDYQSYPVQCTRSQIKCKECPGVGQFEFVRRFLFQRNPRHFLSCRPNST